MNYRLNQRRVFPAPRFRGEQIEIESSAAQRSLPFAAINHKLNQLRVFPERVALFNRRLAATLRFCGEEIKI